LHLSVQPFIFIPRALPFRKYISLDDNLAFNQGANTDMTPKEESVSKGGGVFRKKIFQEDQSDEKISMMKV